MPKRISKTKMIATEDNAAENVAQLSCMMGESADWRIALLSLISGSDLLNQEPIFFFLDVLVDGRSRCGLL